MEEGRCRPGAAPTVAVIGAGAAGTLVTAQLLRADPRCRVTLVDPAEVPGSGVAYGTADPSHLLNVRAGRMSAFADEPDDFVEWAQRRHDEVKPTDFLPRAVYGDYLRSVLAESLRTGRVDVCAARAVDVVPEGPDRPVRVRTTDGTVRADAVVLALGNSPPRALPGRWTTPARPGASPTRGRRARSTDCPRAPCCSSAPG